MFLTIYQMNSGGYWIVTENVAHYMIFECDSVSEAEEMFDAIPGDHHGWCACGLCSERWMFDFDDDDLTNEPMLYDKPALKYKENHPLWKQVKGECIIHYKDGSRKRFSTS